MKTPNEKRDNVIILTDFCCMEAVIPWCILDIMRQSRVRENVFVFVHSQHGIFESHFYCAVSLVLGKDGT